MKTIVYICDDGELNHQVMESAKADAFCLFLERTRTSYHVEDSTKEEVAHAVALRGLSSGCAEAAL